MNYTLSAGTYYVGDPCLALENDKDYYKLVELANINLDEKVKNIEYKGYILPILLVNEDGVYHDNVINSYVVESGMFTIMPEKLVNHSLLKQLLVKGYRIFTLKEETEIEITENTFSILGATITF